MVGEQRLSVSPVSHKRIGSEIDDGVHMLGKYERVVRRKET